jgi:hypothetical protein
LLKGRTLTPTLTLILIIGCAKEGSLIELAIVLILILILQKMEHILDFNSKSADGVLEQKLNLYPSKKSKNRSETEVKLKNNDDFHRNDPLFDIILNYKI